MPTQPAGYRPGQLTRLPTLPHLHNLGFCEPTHRNLPNQTTQLSPMVLRSPQEITAVMGGGFGRSVGILRVGYRAARG